MIGGPLTICRTCDVPHYDNCPTCWGFGVFPRTFDGSPVPLSANVACVLRCPPHSESEGVDWLPCPTCQSTPAGIPLVAGVVLP
jgi:hypothetical protein